MIRKIIIQFNCIYETPDYKLVHYVIRVYCIVSEEYLTIFRIKKSYHKKGFFYLNIKNKKNFLN
jgi:hypothetical protein